MCNQTLQAFYWVPKPREQGDRLVAEHASRTTSAQARACSVVRLGIWARVDRPQSSANFEPFPTTARCEANPIFHFVSACWSPYVSVLPGCLSPLWRVQPMASDLLQIHGRSGPVQEHSSREQKRSA